ncbi:MAG: cytochrome c family protein [Candidatus Krumholzibacteriia bacterium]
MLRVFLILTAALMLLSLASAAFAEDFQYIGSGKCFMCHKKDATGNQMQKWLDSAHSKAYATLATDEAKAVATAKGLGDPQQEGACLKCHVTGYGKPAEAFDAAYKAADKTDSHLTDGVGCEACHGPGSAYKSNAVMKAITAGETDGATVGLITPDEALCRTCHNEESPTFKGFDFAEYSAKIAHPNPEKN